MDTIGYIINKRKDFEKLCQQQPNLYWNHTMYAVKESDWNFLKKQYPKKGVISNVLFNDHIKPIVILVTGDLATITTIQIANDLNIKLV